MKEDLQEKKKSATCTYTSVQENVVMFFIFRFVEMIKRVPRNSCNCAKLAYKLYTYLFEKNIFC